MNSLIMQSFSDYDVILIDDGSTDDSGKICDSFAQQHQCVHVVHQKNGGLSAARNTGIEWAQKNSNSQYLSFVDSDDWVHPDYLKNLYNAMISSGCCVSVGRFLKANDDFYWPARNVTSINSIDPEWLYVHNTVNFIVAWGKLYLKHDFAKLRFPKGRIHEDEFTTWKVLFKYKQVAMVDVPMYAYYQRNDSIIGSMWNEEHLSELEAIEEQKQWIDKYGSEYLKGFIRRRYAVVCARQVRKMVSAKAHKHLIKKYRRQLRYSIHEARPFLPFLHDHSTYESAWPLIAKPIWFVCRVLRKVKRAWSKNNTVEP